MHYKLLQPKRAASLLTILLLLAVVAAMVIAGSRALQETSRTAAVLSSREVAKGAAMTGIFEGMRFMTTSPNTEYGTIVDRTSTNTYSNNPLRRGFTSGSNCSTQTAAEALTLGSSSIDKTCPYYEMAVRDRAGYATSDTAKFGLSSKDFTHGLAKTIPFRGSQVWLQVQPVAGLTSVTFAMCTAINTCGPVTTKFPNTDPVYAVTDFSFTYSYVRIQANYSAYPTTPAKIVGISAGSTNSQVVLGYGYSLVESTGVVGDTRVRYVYAVRPGGPYLSEFASYFDASGIQR